MGDDTLAVSDTARFERHVRVLAEVGMSPELTVRQLLIAGFPVEWIRARFPTVSESAFAMPVESALRRRRNAKPILETSLATTKRGSGPAEQGALPVRSAGLLAKRVVRRTAASSSGSPPLPAASVPTHPRSPAAAQPERVNTALSDGISFQYVPLIQCSFPHMDPGDVTHFTRRNGWLELTLSTARPDTGLPYGVPARLLTMCCASEAIRTHSPEI